VWTEAHLVGQLADLGIASGDTVMVHASLRAVGPMPGRGVTFARAILDAVGPEGTLLAYTDWASGYEQLADRNGRVAERDRHGVVPFDPGSSPATPDNGALAEIVRGWPGALRSANAGASCAAIGKRAAFLTADHALDYGYGERSPLARLVACNGKVLIAGAPLDTMTLLHHAEHLARISGKRIRRLEVPFRIGSSVQWRMIEEFNTSDPVVAGLPDDYFATIVGDFLASSSGRRGSVGKAEGVLVPARELIIFGVRWLEHRASFGLAMP
jgi:aminoglycoside 3-N-acetyltransferase